MVLCEFCGASRDDDLGSLDDVAVLLYDVRCSDFAGFERYLQGGALQKRHYSGATLERC